MLCLGTFATQYLGSHTVIPAAAGLMLMLCVHTEYTNMECVGLTVCSDMVQSKCISYLECSVCIQLYGFTR